MAIDALSRFGLTASGDRVLCALSGGADSVCLTHLLAARAGELGITVAAAHFTHGLRPESADAERQLCQRLCDSLSIPLFCGAGDTAAYAKAHGVGIEEAARTLRRAFLLETADRWQATSVAPVDAVMDEKTFVVTPDVWGYGFDLEAAKAAVAELGFGESLTIHLARIEADQTAQEVGGHLFRDVLGEARTPYKGADDNDRNTNLALACAAINGVILMPGETFSYNETLGERTAAKGYRPAPS